MPRTRWEREGRDLPVPAPRLERDYARAARRWIRVLVAAVYVVGGIAFFALVPPGEEAPAQRPPGPGEHVAALAVRLDVRADGTVAVRETFDYDFGSRPADGFTRYLRDSGVRLVGGVGVDDVRMRGPGGTARVRAYPEPGWASKRWVVARTAAPRGGWTGRHRFVVDYVLRTPETGGSWLAFDAVARDWPGRVDRFSATVTSDLPMSGVDVAVGAREVHVDAAGRDGRRVEVERAPVRADEGLRLTVGLAGRELPQPTRWTTLLRGVLWVLPAVVFLFAPPVGWVVAYLRTPSGGGGAGAGRPHAGDAHFEIGLTSADGSPPGGGAAGGVGGYG